MFSWPLRYCLDFRRVKAPLTRADLIESPAPLEYLTDSATVVDIRQFLKYAIPLALGSLRRKPKTILLRFVNYIVDGGTYPRGGFNPRNYGQAELWVKLRLPDVIQRLILRADPLHPLGKFTDMVNVIPYLCVALIYKAADSFGLFAVRVGDPDAPPIREMEQGFIIAIDKADILVFGHGSSCS